jgi:hypothetical protein
LFDDQRTDAERIAVVERGAEIEALFHRYAVNGPNRSRARLEAVDVREDGDGATARLTVSDGSVPEDDRLQAVRVDGRWLVAQATYCRLLRDGGALVDATVCAPPLVADPGPLDPAAADTEGQAIAALIDGFFGGRSTVGAVEDGEDLEQVGQLARDAGQSFDVVGATTRDIRFTSPDAAEVTFDIRNSSGGIVVTRPGAVVRHDGRWLITRATYCDTIALAGVQCPPPAG